MTPSIIHLAALLLAVLSLGEPAPAVEPLRNSVAIAAEPGGFPQANAVAMAKAAIDAGMRVTDRVALTPGTTDFAALMDKLKAGAADRIWAMPGGSTAASFKAYTDGV